MRLSQAGLGKATLLQTKPQQTCCVLSGAIYPKELLAEIASVIKVRNQLFLGPLSTSKHGHFTKTGSGQP